VYGSVDPDDESGTADGSWMSTDQSGDESSSSQADQRGDSQDDTFEDTFEDIMELDLADNFKARLASIRCGLTQNPCRCKGFRTVNATFINRDKANRALDYLLGDPPQLIDHECVCEWDDFSMSIAEFSRKSPQRKTRASEAGSSSTPISAGKEPFSGTSASWRRWCKGRLHIEFGSRG
jgi:hypothetical protein